MEGHSYIEDILYFLTFCGVTLCVGAAFIMTVKSLQEDKETKNKFKKK